MSGAIQEWNKPAGTAVSGSERPDWQVAATGTDSARKVAIALEVDSKYVNKVRYTLDTLFMAAGIVVSDSAPSQSGVLRLRYGAARGSRLESGEVYLRHDPTAWARICRLTSGKANADEALEVARFLVGTGAIGPRTDADLVAISFFFLASLAERCSGDRGAARALFSESVFVRSGVSQSIVDDCLKALLSKLGIELGASPACERGSFAVVLSHDIDFVPRGTWEIALQGAKTLMRHGFRQRDGRSAWQALKGLTRAGLQGRDPYGGIPEILAGEAARRVKSSFQVAVTRRHAADVNYSVDDPKVREYVAQVPRNGWELCLHGSYTSTQSVERYVGEAERLAQLFGPAIGSRQHFLAFDFDTLFRAQEACNVRFDMSMGYPDHPGPRAGFSFPYFPYCLQEDRPYNVLEISLFLMDVTLQAYQRLSAEAAWLRARATIDHLRAVGGTASIVWHPIVFGGARDPGYDQLYWRLVDYVVESDGDATDGRTINERWRERARAYESFADA